jgi:pimeloyl-ACP methyl ester carboxylesterase
VSSYAEMNICDVSGNKLAYHREGEGETILFVHGITTYSFIWRNLIPHLIDSFDVISIDLLGCGESDKPLNVSYSLKQHSLLIKEFVTKLGIKKFHFVGHDVGGGIGQIFAVNYPEMLIDLVMINTVGYDFWPVQPIISMRTPVIRQLAMASLDIGAFKFVVKRGFYHKEKVTAELMNYFWQPMKTKSGRKAFLHFAKCLDNQNLLEIVEDLKNLTTKALIISGDADIYLSGAISQKLHSEIPGSNLVNVPTGGHFLQEDEPEQVVRYMNTFFEDNRNAVGT